VLLNEIYLGLLAYQALTDDEARRNWEKYGNPDGPGAMSFGIALPSWIVEKENSVWVRYSR
jgi:translocation protein SEC63